MLRALMIVAGAIAIQMFVVADSSAAEIYSEFPQNVDPKRSYVIYSHGLIVEGQDAKPVHDRWGVYDFPAITSRLAEDSSFVLVAHHRPKNTEVSEYVQHLGAWVREIVKAGVEPERITLVGFSRGGEITALAADQLKPMKINTALLATCWEAGVRDQTSITISGRLLSIYETTDQALTCKKIAARSVQLTSFQEVAISTGKEHGAFFTPSPEWVAPLLAWIEQASN